MNIVAFFEYPLSGWYFPKDHPLNEYIKCELDRIDDLVVWRAISHTFNVPSDALIIRDLNRKFSSIRIKEQVVNYSLYKEGDF